MPELTIWDELLDIIRQELDREDFHRWFSETSYAGDSGDRITVWVPSEAIRQHVSNRFPDILDAALEAIGRPGTQIRFLVAGYEDEDDEG